ncbi:2-oxo-hept-4-ene-1,7-dioate hydratase [Phenylobacterium sp. SCN 70-31]|uniref:2-oxo-hept-4-ene-1,7-dioate hydratase n=1 Tax=Phenylobacterium sp. SCN 70-31 TaxID=1660129 RepID=UPI00086AF9D7|nr:2-oxo-hepta-3-ene-1,7-dioic acid hydratase [Phenylobacterium sp. SCN 70-31]ODT87364.1 MAG: 2-oxo-hepta-3-ene-1,7-dioic acid hydratase [Phenylobacterium sp. SCN 70-31]
MDQAQIAEVARRLDDAEKTGRPIRQLSLEYPDVTFAQAYAVQEAWVALKLAAGREVRGHKIGLTSKAMQQLARIDEPDHGVLFDDMMLESGAQIPLSRFIEPRLEVELAFHLKKPLQGPNCTLFDVLDATSYVTPALEIIDARMQRVDPETGATRKVFDTIADNAANGAVVLGGQPKRPDDLDLRWISALMFRNGEIEESGVAAAVMNHPANGIVWLANKVARFGGRLEAGEVVLAGSFTRAVPIGVGDTFHVEYGPLGSVSCRFL